MPRRGDHLNDTVSSLSGGEINSLDQSTHNASQQPRSTYTSKQNAQLNISHRFMAPTSASRAQETTTIKMPDPRPSRSVSPNKITKRTDWMAGATKRFGTPKSRKDTKINKQLIQEKLSMAQTPEVTPLYPFYSIADISNHSLRELCLLQINQRQQSHTDLALQTSLYQAFLSPPLFRNLPSTDDHSSMLLKSPCAAHLHLKRLRPKMINGLRCHRHAQPQHNLIEPNRL